MVQKQLKVTLKPGPTIRNWNWWLKLLKCKSKHVSQLSWPSLKGQSQLSEFKECQPTPETIFPLWLHDSSGIQVEFQDILIIKLKENLKIIYLSGQTLTLRKAMKQWLLIWLHLLMRRQMSGWFYIAKLERNVMYWLENMFKKCQTLAQLHYKKQNEGLLKPDVCNASSFAGVKKQESTQLWHRLYEVSICWDP